MESTRDHESAVQARLQQLMAAKAQKKQAETSQSKPQRPEPKPAKPVVPSEFESLDQIAVGKRTSEVWSDSHLDKINIYPVKQASATEILSLGETMLKAITSGIANSSIVDICLVLAVSLGKPAEQTFSHMLKPPTEALGVKLNWVEPDVTQLGRKAGLTDTQQRAMEIARTRLASETDEEKKKQYEATIKKLEDQEKGIAEQSQKTANSTADANAYCFLAAILLKLYSKSVESFTKAQESWAARFSAWYDTSPAKVKGFKPTEANITALRTVMARRPEIWSTWTWWVAFNDNTKGLQVTHQGLLNYVACQQFAYTGMHAYSLIVDIHEKTGMTFGKLLQQMNCPVTRSGVKAVAEIIRNHEVTSKNPARSTYFRYSRIWNTKYFSALQSTNCRTLLYVAAKVNKIVSTQGQGGDPMEIYALKDMDETMTKRLDAVATDLAERIIDHMLIDDQSGDVWAAK
nr:TPA_asm: N [Tolmeia alphacytorhabdovirus 1]